MELIDILNQEIKRGGGIAKYYEAVMEELHPAPFIARRKNLAITKYRFTTEYLKKNCDTKSLKQLAKELGIPICEVTRRLRELGIKKTYYYPVHQRETCIIIHMQTGIYYQTCLQAALALNYSTRTLLRHLTIHGKYKSLKLA